MLIAGGFSRDTAVNVHNQPSVLTAMPISISNVFSNFAYDFFRVERQPRLCGVFGRCVVKESAELVRANVPGPRVAHIHAKRAIQGILSSVAIQNSK